MAPQSACYPRTQRHGTAEIRLVSLLRRRDPTSQQPALGDPQCWCARGSDAHCGRKSCPNTLSVSALRRRRSPSLVRLITTALYPLHNDDRPFESGTPRGPRPVSAMSLLTHPTLSPPTCSFANKAGPAPPSLWVGFRVDSRGGSDAPCGRKRRPKPGRRLSPAGTSLPPRSNSHLVNGRAPLHEVGRSPTNVDPCCATVTSLAPTRHRTGVLGRVKVPRAPRAAASTVAATLTPPPRARKRATIGASRNYEREHHRMPVVLLADRGRERPGVQVDDATVAPVMAARRHGRWRYIAPGSGRQPAHPRSR
jgi:hypothetical protein